VVDQESDDSERIDDDEGI